MALVKARLPLPITPKTASTPRPASALPTASATRTRRSMPGGRTVRGRMPRVVVTRRLPEPALSALRGAGHDVWVSAEDRALAERELHAAVARADAVLTMLHDR